MKIKAWRLKELEIVEDFRYLGNIISANSNIEREITFGIGQAAFAFRKLNNIWNQSQFTHTKTKQNKTKKKQKKKKPGILQIKMYAQSYYILRRHGEPIR